MKFLLNLAVAAFLATTMAGCVVIGGDHDWDDNDWESQQRENREIISNLKLGTERARVVTKLGAPHFSEAFSRGDDEYRVLFYRTQHVRSDGDTTKDETTPLVFKNDQLIGWGEEALAKARE